DALNTVGGDVLIAGMPLLNVMDQFEYVVSVGGDIDLLGLGIPQINGWSSLLVHDGAIRITDNAGPFTIGAFPKLTAIGHELAIERNSILQEVPGFIALTSVGALGTPGLGDSELRFTDNDAMTSFNGVKGVTRVGGLVFDGNGGIDSVAGFVDLTVIDGPLLVIDNDAVESLVGYSALTEIGGTLVITDNLNLASVQAFDLVSRVGGAIVIGFNRDQTLIDAFAVLTEAGGYELTSGTNLVTIDPMPLLTAITGDLRLDSQALLAAAPVMPALRTVGGDVVVTGTAALTSLDGWLGIESVDGDLTITDNTALSTSEAEALLDAIGVENIGGAVTLSGNAP
ncbi:MAG: hypothetical protein H0V89_03925, partial [Deltaproteobacteria bacterium]|nr:hypothetical protein [Deltaproteobacteria bacterium]